jgi:plasmid stability protein
MDTTIRNLDERVYRELKAWAAREGKTVGQAVNEAIRAYLAGPGARRGTRSLEELRPEPYPEGNERLSEEVDAIVYGIE